MQAVLVTRPQPAADDFADKLAREGFAVRVSPLATYAEEPGDIGPLGVYQAVVFTSAEAVRVFAKRTEDRSPTVFAVGEATARTASQAGFARVWQAEGSSDDVLKLIRGKKADLGIKRILHACGEETAQDLAEALIADGIAVEKKILYRTQYADAMPGDMAEALLDGTVGAVTLFSPRAAAHFAGLMQRRDLRGITARLDAVCLSQRVADEVSALPWRNLSVAAHPVSAAVIDALKDLREKEVEEAEGLAAEPVIAAFGGLRPLAARLSLPPSTVQGWKKRGIIPAARQEEIFRAAAEDNIGTAGFRTKTTEGPMAENGKEQAQGGAEPQKPAERRAGAERRERYSAPDRHGRIHAEGYSGPDRRSGIDRRAFLEKQRQIVNAEKKRFVVRSLVSGGAVLALLAAGIAFIFAPEYDNMRREAARTAAYEARYEAQIKAMNDRLQEMARAGEQQASLGQEITGQLKRIEAAKAAPAAPAAAPVVPDERKAAAYLALIGKVNRLKKTPEGMMAYTAAMQRLYDVLPDRLHSLSAANDLIDAARKEDKLLGALFDGMDKAYLGEAALTLGLGEFQSAVARQQPFDAELSYLKKFGAENADFKASAGRLETYAKQGVPDEQALAREFKGLAMDIVMAKLQGQDLSVQEKVLKRMSKFVKVRNAEDIEGNTVDAIVARADRKIESGDIAGALRELYTLDGPPKEIAKSWINAAESHVGTEGIAGLVVKSLATGVNAGIDTPVENILPMISGAASGKPVSVISGGGSQMNTGALPAPVEIPGFQAQ